MANQAREDNSFGRVPLQPAMRIGLINPLCGLDGSWPCGLHHQQADHNSCQSIGPTEEHIKA
jgi:hypothetical protein